jgi:hypothetical protein
MMAEQFRIKNYELLNIVHCPRGKYYTLLDDTELAAGTGDSKYSDHRLVCRIRCSELRQFKILCNLDLFGKDNLAPN